LEKANYQADVDAERRLGALALFDRGRLASQVNAALVNQIHLLAEANRFLDR
jgi:hypothetical protein